MIDFFLNPNVEKFGLGILGVLALWYISAGDSNMSKLQRLGFVLAAGALGYFLYLFAKSFI